jgi:hypothetical protein
MGKIATIDRNGRNQKPPKRSYAARFLARKTAPEVKREVATPVGPAYSISMKPPFARSCRRAWGSDLQYRVTNDFNGSGSEPG